MAVRDRVRPLLGTHAGRAADTGAEAASGDVTFAIDTAAEELVESYLAEHAPRVAFYSEDRGMVMPSAGEPDTVLVVDPIDGTRPAIAGLESCCVSIAAAPLDGEPTMDDVSVGCVVEIPSGAVFLAERGGGIAEAPPVRLSPNAELETMFWTYGFRGRPARELTEVLAELLDASSVRGGTFDLGSAAFDMTRIATGQLDAYVEPGPRLVEEVPGMRERFEAVGGGAVLNNSPYDLAAAALILECAGAIVTDASGRPLGPKPLLGSGAQFQMSIVASSNARLHELILAEVELGLERLKVAHSG